MKLKTVNSFNPHFMSLSIETTRMRGAPQRGVLAFNPHFMSLSIETIERLLMKPLPMPLFFQSSFYESIY